MRRVCLLVLASALLALASAGCGGKKASAGPVSVSVTVPLEEQLQAPGAQGRTVPWDTLVMDSTVRFPMTALKTPDQNKNAEAPPDKQQAEPQAPVGPEASSGLRVAAARLKARDQALEDLARRVGRMPAAEAPPGEQESLSVSDMARQFPRVDEAVREALAKGWTETFRRVNDREAAITLSLPLETIARAVLAHGGGFTAEHRVTRELGAAGRAERDAIEKAREELRVKLAGETLDDGMTIGEWEQKNVYNIEKMKLFVRSARVTRSELQTDTDGRQTWICEMELDPELIRQTVREEEKVRKAMGIDQSQRPATPPVDTSSQPRENQQPDLGQKQP